MSDILFVDWYRATVKESDVFGNGSDTFNPNVSTGPECSQEFFLLSLLSHGLCRVK